MSERKMRVLSIGAHPDDADTSAGGLLNKLKRKGWEIRMLSVTDGSAGTYHKEQGGQELALMRRAEAAASGALLGCRYDVLDHPDGRLEVTLAIREELIRYIRRFAPDLIITNRLNDYHADHRNTDRALHLPRCTLYGAYARGTVLARLLQEALPLSGRCHRAH